MTVSLGDKVLTRWTDSLFLSPRSFHLPDVGKASHGRLKLRHDEPMYLRKLLIGLICLPLFAQGGLTLTSAGIEARQDTAKLSAMIEATCSRVMR